jgi:cytochrome c biogenesis protein CcmG/thiol:disulfide interchange protein DsbE
LKKYLTISNGLLLLLFVSALYLRAPLILQLFSFQGEPAPTMETLQSIEGQPITELRNKAIIFWASWCGPCEVELGRVNRLIQSNRISAEDVIAISMDTNKSDLLKAIESQNYQFQIAWDPKSVLSDKFKVQVTPTIFVTDQDEKILWASSGLSPSLELRLINYLSKK